ITTVDELESASVEALLEAQGKVLAANARTDLPFMPVVDGTILPELPVRTIASGATGDVPTMVGTTLDEMTLFLALTLGVGEFDGAALNRQMPSFFGDRTDEVIGRSTENRPGCTPGDVLTAISTDRVFRVPAIRLAEAQAAQGRPTWMYLFT